MGRLAYRYAEPLALFLVTRNYFAQVPEVQRVTLRTRRKGSMVLNIF